MVVSATASEFALADRGGDEWFDLGSAWTGTTRFDVVDNVLALGRVNTTRLGEAHGAERGPNATEWGVMGGDGKGTEGGGPLEALVTLDDECLDFTLGGFGTTGESLKAGREYAESLALDVSVSLPEILVL
jgi:hypothetical protein